MNPEIKLKKRLRELTIAISSESDWLGFLDALC